MASRWKTFKEIPRYAVAKSGEVFCKKTNRILPQQTNEDGYKLITLTLPDGSRKTYRVHRMVAKTYLKNPEDLPEVNHKNGKRSVNRLSNLEWIDRSGNVKHSWKLRKSR